MYIHVCWLTSVKGWWEVLYLSIVSNTGGILFPWIRIFMYMFLRCYLYSRNSSINELSCHVCFRSTNIFRPEMEVGVVNHIRYKGEWLVPEEKLPV